MTQLITLDQEQPDDKPLPSSSYTLKSLFPPHPVPHDTQSKPTPTVTDQIIHLYQFESKKTDRQTDIEKLFMNMKVLLDKTRPHSSSHHFVTHN